MTTKHTPEPWEIRSESPESVVAIWSPSAEIFVCTCLARDSDLIAAAPELLEALRHALNFVDAMEANGSKLVFREPINGHHKLEKLLRAAIRKAEGGGT